MSNTAWAIPDGSPQTRLRGYASLFLISFVSLFLELACIRWFASTVVFLTFFTNLVLTACFLGLSVGLLAASGLSRFVNAVIPLMLAATALAYSILWGYHRFETLAIDVGGQQSPQQIFFGTEVRSSDPSKFVIPIEVIAGVVFALVALVFVGIGQAMGRCFNGLSNRVVAYTINVLGSLAGIAAFGATSVFWMPPVVWFAIGLVPVLGFTSRWWAFQCLCLTGVLGITSLDWIRADAQSESAWSPYYKVGLDKNTRMVYANNIFHQILLDTDEMGPAYSLVHLLNRDSGGAPFGDVLVIGAGGGNDVAAALSHGARSVDAVEIDPRILEIGRTTHPERPYDDPRVTPHLNDGRRFVKATSKQYDLIVYALVDSLVLHSGYSSLRLESFLFTEQAFRDIRARLKPGGLFVMYNFYRQGWVVGRLKSMAEAVFGANPIVISLPYQARVALDDSQAMHLTVLLAGGPGSDVMRRVREALGAKRNFWASAIPRLNRGVNAFGPAPPAIAEAPPGLWQKIGLTHVDTREIRWTPTDNWPFLYLREPTVPALNLRGMAIIAALSAVILILFTPRKHARLDGRMFFLGAGFMLLETKGVVHMALLFGSTWVVNSVVFAAILTMILLSNLFVLWIQPRRLGPAYVLLVLALLLNAAVPMTVFLDLPGPARVVTSCALVFLPVFFAGVIFAVSFRESSRPDVDLGSNIIGVIAGGMSESLSLMIGFDQLLYVAILFYVLSALFRLRGSAGPAIGPA